MQEQNKGGVANYSKENFAKSNLLTSDAKFSKEKKVKIFSVVLIILGVFTNPIIIQTFFSPDGDIESLLVKIIILFINFFLIGIGVFFYFRPLWLLEQWREILLLTVISLLGLASLEFSLHAFVKPRILCIEDDTYLGWGIQIRCNTVFTAPEYSIKITTNDQRMRESENFSLAPQKYRIALIGDSFIFGIGVDEEQRIGEHLQKLLGNEREVINFGVTGYGTDQYYLKIKKDVLMYNPHIIIVHFVFV